MFRGQESKSSWSCFGGFIGKISDDAESLVAMAAGQGTFVSCLATSEMFGRDVYAHTNVLTECGLVPGDIICFKVHVNKKGWPQFGRCYRLKKQSVLGRSATGSSLAVRRKSQV